MTTIILTPRILLFET